MMIFTPTIIKCMLHFRRETKLQHWGDPPIFFVCTLKNVFGRFNFIWPSFEARLTIQSHFYFGVSSTTSSELEELICLCKWIAFSFDSCHLWKSKFFTTAAIMYSTMAQNIKHHTHCWNYSSPPIMIDDDKEPDCLGIERPHSVHSKSPLDKCHKPFSKTQMKILLVSRKLLWSTTKYPCPVKKRKVLPSESILIEKSVSDNDCENQSICSPCMCLTVAKVK